MFRKSILKFISCFLIICSLVTHFSVYANPDHGTITVGTFSAVEGDSVVIPISIENNPGMMAITISITYDSSIMSYERYYKGYLNDYLVVDHPDKNLVRFVNCEDYNRKNNDILLSLEFKIKDDVEFGFYPIKIEYKSGDFSNWKLEKLMPEIVNGGVDIAYNGENCKHREYDEWETVATPGCTEPGIKQHSCKKCGHIEKEELEPVGHDFSLEWTVDTPATVDADGVMSRHCSRCGEKTDILTFSMKDTEKNDVVNKPGETVQPSETTEKLIKEQVPKEKQKTFGKSKTGDTSSVSKTESNKTNSDSSKETTQNGENGENSKDNPSSITEPIKSVTEKISKSDNTLIKSLSDFAKNNSTRLKLFFIVFVVVTAILFL